MLQATPVCAFLFFLACSPGAPELHVRSDRSNFQIRVNWCRLVVKILTPFPPPPSGDRNAERQDAERQRGRFGHFCDALDDIIKRSVVPLSGEGWIRILRENIHAVRWQANAIRLSGGEIEIRN